MKTTLGSIEKKKHTGVFSKGDRWLWSVECGAREPDLLGWNPGSASYQERGCGCADISEFQFSHPEARI